MRTKRKDAKWQYVQSVLVTVGNMTITWSGIERVLDELIAWYQQNCTDLSKPHPLQFRGHPIPGTLYQLGSNGRLHELIVWGLR